MAYIGRKAMKNLRASVLFDVAVTILILTVSTLLGVLFRELNFHKTNVVVLYIFSVLIISRVTKGYLFGIIGITFGFRRVKQLFLGKKR